MSRYATRVKQTTTSEGSGDIVLIEPAPAGYRTIEEVWPGETSFYVGYVLLAADGIAWERGHGKWVRATKTLIREFVMESTNAGAAIVLPAGTHTINISPSPDTANRRGFMTSHPEASQTINDTQYRLISFKTNPPIWDSEGILATPAAVSDFVIPNWVDKVRISASIRFADAVDAGARMLAITQMGSIAQGEACPRITQRGHAEISATAEFKKDQVLTLTSQLLDTIRDLGGDASNKGFRVYTAQASGQALTLAANEGYCSCEFVE